MTLVPQARSRLRCCTGLSSASTMTTLTFWLRSASATRATWPVPSKVPGRGSRSEKMA